MTSEKLAAAGEKKPRPRSERVVLGWREWVALPELGILSVKAKVDTGARSSSLHAEDVEILEDGGERMVRFRVGDPKKLYKLSDEPLIVPLLEERWITSSNGKRQKRPVIRACISLAGSLWTIELSLAKRTTMGFPMLLGREALRGRFMVEPGRSFLAKEHIPTRPPKARASVSTTAEPVRRPRERAQS